MHPRYRLMAGLVLSCSFCLAETPAVRNGGFEEVSAESMPAGWQFYCANGCQGQMAVDSEIHAGGTRSFRLSSRSELSPHVYCGVMQAIPNVVPGTTYRFSLKARGEETGDCWFGGGPNWALRYTFPAETFDWTEFDIDWTCPEGVDTFEFRINVDSETDSLWIDDVSVAVVSDEDPAAAAAEAGEQALEIIAAQEARLPGVESLLAKTAQEGMPVLYPRADFETARMFMQFCRDDVANGRAIRALYVAREVRDLLDRAEREMRRGVDVPALVKESPITIRDGSFWATCSIGGQEREQPVFLTGYGHFNRVVDELPLLSRLGTNIIQIEIGPNSVVFEDGARTNAIEDRILPALDRARDNGARVCLLVSPHYFPAWAFEKWPELAVDNTGFLKVAIDAPQARDIYKRFLEVLIPLVKDHPALHSICLSNEPVSGRSHNDPFRLPLWHAYLARKFGDIAAFNARFKTTYAAFSDVPHPKMDFEENPALLYEGVRFNQASFAEWHAWMADVIHGIAPNLPCHAKVMLLPRDRGTVLWGTDPWDFAKLSQLNGNDCPFLQAPKGSPWVSNWDGQNMYYDLERSMKRVPIFNTENHIIPDREDAFVEPAHIYTAIWQGAIHGQGASTAWVWERSYDRKSDFDGSILHRPGCVAAMSRCGMDLMRCASTVAAIQNAAPRVALLYSHAATVWDNKYVTARTQAYQALNFCGIPIGFITDEQIAAGELSRYDCLVVTSAVHAARAAIDGTRAFQAGGGQVIAYGKDNLTADEYGDAVEPPAFSTVILPRRASARESLRDDFLSALNTRELGPAEEIHTPDGRMPYGVEWRCATFGGRRLINLVNFRRAPCEVVLPEGGWTDLISGQPLDNPVTLQADTPVLAAAE